MCNLIIGEPAGKKKTLKNDKIPRDDYDVK